jgi:hypothetical protein
MFGIDLFYVFIVCGAAAIGTYYALRSVNLPTVVRWAQLLLFTAFGIFAALGVYFHVGPRAEGSEIAGWICSTCAICPSGGVG